MYRSWLSHALPTLHHFPKKTATNCTCRKDLHAVLQLLWTYSHHEANNPKVGVLFSASPLPIFARILYRHLFSRFTTDIGCVPFGESKNGFLILDLPDFAVERNVKSEIGFVTLVTFRQRVQYAGQPLKKWRVFYSLTNYAIIPCRI